MDEDRKQLSILLVSMETGSISSSKADWLVCKFKAGNLCFQPSKERKEIQDQLGGWRFPVSPTRQQAARETNPA